MYQETPNPKARMMRDAPEARKRQEITDGMVERAYNYLQPYTSGAYSEVHYRERARSTLEAALNPPDLRKGSVDRRKPIARLATPIDLGGHASDCPAAMAYVNPGPPRLYLCTCDRKSAPDGARKDQGWVMGPWTCFRCGQTYTREVAHGCPRDDRRPTDPTGTASAPPPPKQDTAPLGASIFLSDAIVRAGWEALEKWGHPRKLIPDFESMCGAYRAMHAQMLKEQQWDGTGPGGA